MVNAITPIKKSRMIAGKIHNLGLVIVPNSETNVEAVVDLT